MRKKIFHFLRFMIVLFCLILPNIVKAQLTYSEYVTKLKKAASSDKVKLSELGVSAGGNSLYLLQAGEFKDGDPAIFVAANINGDDPLATQSALWLLEHLKADYLQKNTTVNWYILPCGSPDAFKSSLASKANKVSTNATPINNDMDENIDEDGPEDINGDGLILKMLVKHPLGTYIKDKDDPRIIKQADADKGEKGIYKVYTEGLDNDGDGKYNEDPPGGVMINRNFTYDYTDFKPEYGKWLASEKETRAILKFFYEHREIAASIVLGAGNTLLFPHETKGSLKEEKIKVPSYYASRLELDAKKSYSEEELRKEISKALDDPTQADSYVKSLLNQKAPESILNQDAALFKRVSDAYKEHLKEQHYPTTFVENGNWESGSFEKFSYFQAGLPTFSLSTWQLPEIEKDKEDKKSKDSYEHKLLAYADSVKWKIFSDWTRATHPDFGEVELGGFLPYFESNLPGDSLEDMFQKQLSFVEKIADMLPKFSMTSEVEMKGKGIYEITLYVSNEGEFPYPIEIGYRNDQPFPNVIELSGEAKLLSGKTRTPLGRVKAKSTVRKTYLLLSKKGEGLAFELKTENCTSVKHEIELP